jgi:hypothetical protein
VLKVLRGRPAALLPLLVAAVAFLAYLAAG